MRRHRPRNRVLLWATRSLVFRSDAAGGGGPRVRRAEPGEERPFKAARSIDWVSWLAGLPELPDALSKPPERRAEDPAPATEPIAVPGNSIRVSLKIRHTI